MLKPLYYMVKMLFVFSMKMGNVKPASYDEKKRVREAYEKLKKYSDF